MASVPGTSSSSGGGGSNQLPNKRIKMETHSNNSSDLKSSQDKPASIQIGAVSSAIRVKTEHLKCPVCQDYPRKEVYQCSNGHIVCHECFGKITRCGVCRKDYGSEKIRNRIAETELDEMRYTCSSRDHGCLVMNISRSRRTAHDIQCGHNPTKPGIKFCGLFKATEACQFRIDPDWIMQDPQHCKDVISHLTTRSPKLVFQKVAIGENWSFTFRLPNSCWPIGVQPAALFEVYNGRTIIGYYALIVQISIQKDFALYLVALNSAPEHLNAAAALFAINPKPDDQNKRGKDGGGSVQDQNWIIKSTHLNEWKDFMMIPSAERPLPNFSLPLPLLSDNYKTQDGSLKIFVMFGP